MKDTLPADSLETRPTLRVDDATLTAQLVILGPDLSTVVPVTACPVSFGSDLGNEVVLTSGNVSPHHCSIVPTARGGHRVLGLQTYQDLALNGRAVDEALLEPFDRIEFGGIMVVYLPADVDALYVQSLLAVPDAATCQVRPPGSGGEPMRERLLWLLLMLQSLPPGAPIEPVFDLIMLEVRRWSGYRSAALLLRRGEGSFESLKVLQGDHERPALSERELAGCQELFEQVIARRQVREGETELVGFEHALCLPVSNVWSAAHERRRFPIGLVEGVLVLGAPEPLRRPSQETLALLRAMLRQIAILLGNVRVFRQATVDPLTGLANRACSQRVLDEEFDRARVLRSSLACLMVDVDDFKQINDTYGHLIGDEVLTQLATRLRAELRDDDFACRWGGEEFLVVLPGTDRAGAERVAEKLVQQVTWHQIRRGGPRVTVSVGVALFPEHADGVQELIDHADQALYAAKRAGKARHRVYQSQPAAEAFTPRPAGRDRLHLLHPLIEPVELRPGKLTLGRSKHADVCLHHPRVSREHGVIEVDDAGIHFEDCSANGSFHNQAAVAGRVTLAAGDTLRVGPFDLLVAPADPAEAPTPFEASPLRARGNVA